jgi:hypothetical protein
MVTFMNFLADLPPKTFFVSLIGGILCLAVFFWIIGTSQAF